MENHRKTICSYMRVYIYIYIHTHIYIYIYLYISHIWHILANEDIKTSHSHLGLRTLMTALQVLRGTSNHGHCG